METKYMINGGLAFSEESDLRKLKKQASKGWLLEGFVAGGFLYKLVKNKPTKLIYSIDYQNQADAEYFDYFKEAGWKHVTTYGKQIHIFSSAKASKPIYSDSETEVEKYATIAKQLKKSAIFSFIALVVFSLLHFISIQYFRPIFIPSFALFLISVISFIFCIMPYFKFSLRIKKLNSSSSKQLN